MTNEAYLCQAGILSRKIAYHMERLRRMRLEADAVSSHWGERGGGGSGEAPYVRMLERIESGEEELDRENELLARLKAQTEETISRLPQEKMKLVLLYKYLEGMSYREIGDLLYMDKGTAKRWQDRALACMTLPEDAICIPS